MDGSASISRSVRQNRGVGVDRISSLHDHILLHILSFLPTKYAVAASLLSRRWENLFTSISKLEISDKQLYSTESESENPMVKENLMNFVDRVLLLHDASSIDSFPVLEEFRTHELGWKTFNTVNISAPSLKRLIIHDDVARIKDCEINIFAESLIFFELTSQLECEYNLHNLSSEVGAVIDAGWSDDNGHRVIKLLRGICNVKDLQLCRRATHTLSAVDSSGDMPTFSNLINLRVSADLCVNDRDLVNILHKMLSIESLYLEGSTPKSLGQGLPTLEIAPPCVLSRLKLVTLGYYKASESDLCLVKFLLRNAMILEKMTIIFCYKLRRDPEKKVEVISHSDHLDHMRAFSSLIILKVAQSGNWSTTLANVGQFIDLLCHLPNVELLLFQNSVKLEHFHGSANELYLVNFLLKNAAALGKMTVISSLKLSEDPKKQLEVTKKLLLHRGSSCSEIEFS
ncbi:hypothetical protein IFM89_017001 [Coptis chinensis]|uniref:FBD domain-containing protein n=1 Tax=Coptis chinensis TaxID=261450 RepID=A0A835IWB3_9MAGN|nr:hypothetical protein IFM89_017001 [Coptis chinensis]